MKTMTFALMLALATLFGGNNAQAQEVPALDLAALSDLTSTNLPLLPLLESPGRYLALGNVQTLNAIVLTVSTLPGVSSPAPTNALIRGLLSNF